MSILFVSIRSNNQFVIESQKLDGSDRTVITQGRGHCHSISYDWVGNNIFWASSRKIEVFSLVDPNITKTLIHVHNAGYTLLISIRIAIKLFLRTFLFTRYYWDFFPVRLHWIRIKVILPPRCSKWRIYHPQFGVAHETHFILLI